MTFYKIIATFSGIGYIGRGAGTVAAFITCVLLYLGAVFGLHSDGLLLGFILATLFAGVYAAGKVEKSWGKDSKRVVIDEVLGMAITMLFLPINLFTLLTGFLLFRFFDIVKPLGIKKTEQLKGGWGVMTDDLLAGIYSNLVLQLIVHVITNYYEDIF
jgi:phosphatidylglycerophosphatase A